MVEGEDEGDGKNLRFRRKKGKGDGGSEEFFPTVVAIKKA
jgi:hypothetical protein